MSTMAFAQLKAGLDQLLTSKAAGRFAVAVARGQNDDAEKIKDQPQLVSYYDEGNFSKSSPEQGPIDHEVTVKIELLVSVAASLDLVILQDPNATTDQVAAALAASTDAQTRADDLCDRFISLVWAIVMDPRNSSLGLDYDPRRWITRIDKGAPAPRGALVLMSAILTMTAIVSEYPPGEVGIPGVLVESDITLSADPTGAGTDTAQQGVQEDLT